MPSFFAMCTVQEGATTAWRLTDMNSKNSTHYIDGYQIDLSPSQQGLEVEINTGHICYRATWHDAEKLLRTKRDHCSIAVAEPLVSIQMLESMNKAVAQRQKVKV